MEKWRHPQNRKYITHYKVVRRWLSHGHGQHAQKIAWNLCMWFWDSERTDRQTDRYREVGTLIAILRSTVLGVKYSSRTMAFPRVSTVFTTISSTENMTSTIVLAICVAYYSKVCLYCNLPQRGKPQSKSNLVRCSFKIWHLVTTVLLISRNWAYFLNGPNAAASIAPTLMG